MLCLTAVATVAFDLILAVEVGLVAAAVLALRQVARTAQVTPVSPEELDRDTSDSLLHEGILTYRLDGALFFGAAQRFLTELTAVSDAKVVVLRLPDIQVLDATGAQALGEIVAELEDRGITVLLKGPRPEHLRVLVATGALDHLAHENHVFEELDAALAHARSHVERAPRRRSRRRLTGRSGGLEQARSEEVEDLLEGVAGGLTGLVDQVLGEHGVGRRGMSVGVALGGVDLDADEPVAERLPQVGEAIGRHQPVVGEPQAEDTEIGLGSQPLLHRRQVAVAHVERRAAPSS